MEKSLSVSLPALGGRAICMCVGFSRAAALLSDEKLYLKDVISARYLRFQTRLETVGCCRCTIVAMMVAARSAAVWLVAGPYSFARMPARSAVICCRTE